MTRPVRPELPEPFPPAEAAELAERLRRNVERAVRGKPRVVERAVETLIAGGHLLLEDVPGVGKTTLASALARSLDATFRRIQFTSDLLPSDVVGSAIPELAEGRPTGRMRFQPGPLFANVVLADEINRASPKTQSALLEAMSDRHVSVDGITHALPDPFFVLATQNPLEHHGTSPLPESQLDRFHVRLSIGYPSEEDEAAVLRDDPGTRELPRLAAVLHCDDLRRLRASVDAIKFDDALIAYLLAIVRATRDHETLVSGASTRAALALRRAAQARALVDGRDYAIPEDVRDTAVDVLAHRVVAGHHGGDPGAEEATWTLHELVRRTPVPF